MWYENCKRLLTSAVDAGLIKTVSAGMTIRGTDGKDYPAVEGDLLIYREAGSKYPEGWYVQSLEYTAEELAEDLKGQEFILSELQKAGITPDLIDEEDIRNDMLEMLDALEQIAIPRLY